MCTAPVGARPSARHRERAVRGTRPDTPRRPRDDGFRPAAPPAWTRWLPFLYTALVLLLEAALHKEWR
ncbi:hypothetical protein JYK04_08223 [Streptomyces nojiriensis]|nr:hypothetical protein JYK04_08223 [Streptomyces nojiriensis]